MHPLLTLVQIFCALLACVLSWLKTTWTQHHRHHTCMASLLCAPSHARPMTAYSWAFYHNDCTGTEAQSACACATSADAASLCCIRSTRTALCCALTPCEPSFWYSWEKLHCKRDRGSALESVCSSCGCTDSSRWSTWPRKRRNRRRADGQFNRKFYLKV